MQIPKGFTLLQRGEVITGNCYYLLDGKWHGVTTLQGWRWNPALHTPVIRRLVVHDVPKAGPPKNHRKVWLVGEEAQLQALYSTYRLLHPQHTPARICAAIAQKLKRTPGSIRSRLIQISPDYRSWSGEPEKFLMKGKH